MSQTTSSARALRASAPDRHSGPKNAPHLRVVEGTRGHTRRTLVPILAAVVVLFLLAIILPLVVNTDMAQTSYNIRDQRVKLNGQMAQIESLEGQLLDQESTRNLEKKAKEIGMVPAGTIGVISLDDHQVRGGEVAR